jgi:hypothetical protein
MADIQNHGQTVGRVTTTFNGEKIQVDVYEDRCVILPDGTVRKVKQEVVDTLIAKNRVMNPAHAPQEEPMPAPAPEPPQQYAESTAPEQEEYQQPQEPAPMPMQQPAGQPNVQQFINQLHTPAAPAPQPVEQPAQQEAVPSQPESQQAQPAAPVPEQKPKKSFFGKEKKEKPKKEKKKKEKAQAPAPTPAPTPIPEPTPPQTAPAAQPYTAPAPSEKKKSKAGVVVVGVLVAVVAACSAMYAFVPAFYDGVNGILTSITGTQVGIPPVTTTKQTITSQQAASALGEDALSGIDLSGDVTIDFYAKIHTADGQEYEVPLSSADLANGTIQSLLEASGSGSTTNTAQ